MFVFTNLSLHSFFSSLSCISREHHATCFVKRSLMSPMQCPLLENWLHWRLVEICNRKQKRRAEKESNRLVWHDVIIPNYCWHMIRDWFDTLMDNDKSPKGWHYIKMWDTTEMNLASHIYFLCQIGTGFQYNTMAKISDSLGNII